MNVIELLDDLLQCGITLTADGDDLLVECGKGQLTDARLNAIRQNKAALLTLVTLTRGGKTSLDATPIGSDCDPWLPWADAEIKALLGTPWLLSYRSVIEAATTGLLPPGPAEISHDVTIDDPARAVTDAVQAITVIAAISRGRASTEREKRMLLKHFDTLKMIAWWRQDTLDGNVEHLPVSEQEQAVAHG
jgi:hypothetical protein